MHLSWSMTLTQRCSRSPTVMPSSVIGGDRQSERRGAVPVVVDVNDLTAGPVQQRRADGRAEAAGAVHPYLAGRNLPGALFQVPERDMDRAGQVPGAPLVGAADIEHDLAVTAPRCGQRREVSDLVAGQPAAGQVAGSAGRRRRKAVDADPGELQLGRRYLPGGLADQGERRAPRDRPRQVGGERVTE